MKTRLLTFVLLLLGVAVGAQEAVDLGLSVKWATCNVGANTPDGCGLYFAWGDTIGYTSDINDGHSFDWANYKWCKGSNDSMTKYCTLGSYGDNDFTDDKIVLEAADDAATAHWGDAWRIPTIEEWSELRDSCVWDKKQLNGMNGYRVSAPNGNYIFLPVAGGRYGAELNKVGSSGYYWSSSLYIDSPAYVSGVLLNSDDAQCGGTYSRFRGLSVRPVYDSTPTRDPSIYQGEEHPAYATKLIRNGKLVIICDGKEYNALGTKL